MFAKCFDAERSPGYFEKGANYSNEKLVGGYAIGLKIEDSAMFTAWLYAYPSVVLPVCSLPNYRLPPTPNTVQV